MLVFLMKNFIAGRWSDGWNLLQRMFIDTCEALKLCSSNVYILNETICYIAPSSCSCEHSASALGDCNYVEWLTALALKFD